MKNGIDLQKIAKRILKIKISRLLSSTFFTEKIRDLSPKIILPAGLVVLGLALFVFVDFSRTKPSDNTARSFTEVIENCLNKSDIAFRIRCYDKAATDYLTNHTPEEILGEFKSAMEQSGEVRQDCHQIAHAMGRATLTKLGSATEVFQLDRKLDACAGGFFHGAIEKMFRPADGEARLDGRPGDDTPIGQHIGLDEFKNKIPTLCDQFEEIDRKSECIHGIGHGAMYLMADLEKSLDSCTLIPKSSDRFSCHSGVFMEYHISGRSLADNRRDRHFPCSSTDDKFKNPCYYVQSFRLAKLNLEKEEIIKECRKAGNPEGGFCVRGYGIFFLAHEALAKEPDIVVQFCESLDRADARVCAESVASRLAANTEDGQYAMPFCSAFKSDYLRERCFAYTADVLRLGHKVSNKSIIEDCQKYAKHSEECMKKVN